MLQTKIVCILPLLVAATSGQANIGIGYYGSSNVRDQRPINSQPLYGRRPLPLPGRPMPLPRLTVPPIVGTTSFAVPDASTVPAATPLAPSITVSAEPVPALVATPVIAAAPAIPAAPSYTPVYRPNPGLRPPLYTPGYKPLLPSHPSRPISLLPPVSESSHTIVVDSQPANEGNKPTQPEGREPDLPLPEPETAPLPAPVSTPILKPERIELSVVGQPETIPQPALGSELIPQLEPALSSELAPELVPASATAPTTIDVVAAPAPLPAPLPAQLPIPVPALAPVPVSALEPAPAPVPEPAPAPVLEPISAPVPVPTSIPVPEPLPAPMPKPVLVSESEPVAAPEPAANLSAPVPTLVLKPESETPPEREMAAIPIVASPGLSLSTAPVTPATKPVALPPLLPKRKPDREPVFGRQPIISTTAIISDPTPSYPSSTALTETPPVVIPTQSHPTVTIPNGILIDFQCNNVNGYYPVDNECDTYIECKQNEAIKYSCPDGLNFNPAAKYFEYPCAYPSEVKCMEGARNQSPKPTDLCPNQYGFYSMHDTDCSKFIMCQEGLATVMDCPMGLVFNPQISSCDWPANVPQCNPYVFKDFTCPEPPVDEYGQVSDIIYKYRYGGQCTLYVACQLGHPRLLSCDRGLSFDESSQTCIDEDLVPDCAVPYSSPA